jgi:hypothetical protein
MLNLLNESTPRRETNTMKNATLLINQIALNPVRMLDTLSAVLESGAQQAAISPHSEAGRQIAIAVRALEAAAIAAEGGNAAPRVQS